MSMNSFTQDTGLEEDFELSKQKSFQCCHLIYDTR